MAVKSKLQLNKQMNFIEDMISKLKKDMQESMGYYETNDIYHSIPNHTRMQNDIIRIRRELMELSKMLNPYD